MDWLLLGILIYTLAGAIIAVLSMRGMIVKASIGEWLTILFLWPLMLHFFAHLAMMQSMIRNIGKLSENLDENP
jgi:hypothetical protein